MKKITKFISLFIMAISLVSLTGCNDKTPTEAMTEYMDVIKGGSDSKIIQSIIASNNSLTEDENAKEMTKKIISKYGNMTYTINSEEINGEEAKVNVTANVPDLNKAMQDFIQEALSKSLESAFSSEKPTEEEQNKFYEETFSKLLENISYVDNTADITLVKKDNTWEIKNEDDMKKLLVNVNLDALEKFTSK